nr:modifier of mdg4-like isoform X2 [Cherax quadricarinatus]
MAEGMLSLSWNNHSATFTHTLSTLREKERYTDVTLACDGKFYPVHKLVLSTCSEYFMKMFETTPCKHPIVVLKDVYCKEMEALLSYMYAGVVSVAQSDLPQLIKVAEALQIKGLAVPDESLCSNMKFGHTWSPTDDRSSPYPKQVRREENGSQTPRIIEPRAGISPQSLTRFSGPQAFTTIGSSFGNMMTPHRFAPYHRDGDLQHIPHRSLHRLDHRKDKIITPRISHKPEHKSETRMIHQTSIRPAQNCDQRLDKGSSPREDQIADKKTDHLSNESRVKDIDTEDDTSSDMQEVVPVSLVKVEVKDADDDEHIDVDDTGTNYGSVCTDQEAAQKFTPYDQPKVEASDDTRCGSSGTEGGLVDECEVKDEMLFEEEYPAVFSEYGITCYRSSATDSQGNQSSVDKSEEQSDTYSSIQASSSAPPQPQHPHDPMKDDAEPGPSGLQELMSDARRAMHSVFENAYALQRREELLLQYEESAANMEHQEALQMVSEGSDAQRAGLEGDLSDRDNASGDLSNNIHQCPECSYSTPRHYLLVRHLRTHTGERPYQCPHCPHRGTDKGNLNVHIRTHTGEKPFACSLCPARFTQNVHLKDHLCVHTGEKPYACPHCPYRCTKHSGLRRHIKTHFMLGNQKM